jgi:DNA polymerase-1
MAKTFAIIDGHALIHRAYHALPPLTTKDGRVVNAAYGFSMILLKVIEELKPDCIAVAMDLPGGTFRHQQYEGYKAQRPKAADDLVEQFFIVRQVIDAFNIPIFEEPGYEADDVIGTMAKELSRTGDIETYIVTGDLDELQLVDEKTKVYTMKRGFTDTVVYDLAAVKERYGLSPQQFVDYKALKGDASDNIPGVAGIGEKSAGELIKNYNDLDNLYKHLDDLKPAIAKKLTEGKENAYLSKELSEIVTDVPLKMDLVKCETNQYDREKVLNLFRELEFKSLMNKLPGEKQADLFDEKAPKTKSREHFTAENYKLVTDEKDLWELVKKLEKAEVIAIGTQATSLIPCEANLCGISLSIKEGEGFYVPVAHRNCVQLEKQKVIEVLGAVLSNRTPKVGHNLKFSYIVLRNAGFQLSPVTFDTMIAAYLLNTNARSLKLSELAFSEFGVEMAEIEELIGKGKNQICFDCVDLHKAALYAAEDADMTLRLYHHLKPQLRESNLLELMEKIEIPLLPVLAEMELTGIELDCNLLKKISGKFEKKIKGLEEKIYKNAGEEFNISSPGQLQKILFEKLMLQNKIEKKELKRLPSGGYSTGAEELGKLKDTHPIIELIQEYRELTKLKNTYLDTLPELADKKSRIHTTFNQAMVATGRLSSSNPNLQNIPIRSEVGQDIRRSFIARKGFKLISADYSQIELRVIAHIAKDDTMIKAFKDGHDIHTATAAEVYGVPENKVTSRMRGNAKAVNFGIIYGVSPHGLQRSTGMEYDEAKNFIDKYFSIHSEIKKYLKEIVEFAREKGYVETIFGRRRYLPELNSSNFIVRGSAERMAMNMPIQGTAADLLKLAMIQIAHDLTPVSKEAKMLLTVHDELVFEVPDKDIEKVRKLVRERMENVAELAVPIVVDIGVGQNWGDAK